MSTEEIALQVEEFLEQSADRLPDKTALVFEGRRWTYADLDTRANRLAHALKSFGVRRGDRVAVYLPNGPEAVLAMFAALKAGAVFLVINPTTKARKLQFVLQDAGARVLVAPTNGQSRWIRSVSEQLPNLRAVVWTGEILGFEPSSDKGTESFERLVEENEYPATRPERTCIDVDLAALIYTSGSTGQPKGVMLTHLNMVSAATSITTYLENREDDVILNVLPMSFDYGLYQILMGFKIGGTVVLERSFTYPHVLMERIREEHVTGFPILPTILSLLFQMDLSRYDFSSLRYLTNTGAVLPESHIRELRALVPHAGIYSMYGLTECKRVSYLPPEEIDRRPTSVGRAMPNTEVLVVDERGSPVGPGVVGELVVRGSNVMQGYWNLPQETDRILRPGTLQGEKILHTGDLFRSDEEGYLYFVGRKDDIFKSRGEKVSPREVENVLYLLEGIAEAAVIGVPDAVLGQAIEAFVVLKLSCELSERDILRHCAQHLENFMVPAAVTIQNEMPRTSSGKIDKTQLRELRWKTA